MPNTYTELFYHFVWATKSRQEYVTPSLEPRLYDYINLKASEMNVTVLAIGGLTEHVHLACVLPTSLSIASFMKVIKGTSSHFANHLSDSDDVLAWQPGYGALTFSRHDVPRIVSYIKNQKRHHAEGTLLVRLEKTEPTAINYGAKIAESPPD